MTFSSTVHSVPSSLSSSSSAIVEMEQWLFTMGQQNHLSNNNSTTTTTSITTAHTAIQILRDNGDDQCLFLRTIIEIQQKQQQQQQQQYSNHHHHQYEELLFHCILGCRHVVLGKWDQSYSILFLQRLRDYFMIYGHTMIHYNRTIRLACYTTAASFWKRMWITSISSSSSNTTTTITSKKVHVQHPLEQQLLAEMSPICSMAILQAKDSLFEYLNAFIVQQGQQQQQPLQQQQQQFVAEFLECIISELGSTSMAVNYRMPIEFHKAAHRAFETDGALYQSLQLTITCIGQLTSSAIITSSYNLDTTLAIIQLLNSILGWEFGTSAWSMIGSSSGTLIRPPKQWKDYVGQVEIIHAILRIHNNSIILQPNGTNNSILSHNIRQVLLQLASITGLIFTSPTEQIQYASALCEGCLHLIQQVATGSIQKEESTILLDIYQIVSRLVSNFRLSLLLDVPKFIPLLTCVVEMGCTLLMDHVRDCEIVGGDVDSMELYDWREEALGQLLDCAVSISGDQWLWHGTTNQLQNNTQRIVADVLCPLFDAFVICRTRMAALEEMYVATNESDLDEVREGITEVALIEEVDAIAAIGRLNLTKSIECLSTLCGTVIPRLHHIWDADGDVSPDISSSLEEANLLILCISHLLTDNNEGESPSIPDAIMISCSNNDIATSNVASAVHVLLQLADIQIQKISMNPYNQRLSPLIAKTLLRFVNRWAPAYLCPVDYEPSNTANRLVQEWSTNAKAKSTIDFCTTLCLNYLCYWPQEPLVRDLCCNLLRSLSKRSVQVRQHMIAASAFQSIVQCHCIVSGIRHTITQSEFEATIQLKAAGCTVPSVTLLWGYHRLPYSTKAFNLTTILIACSDSNDTLATTMINDSLKVIHDAFTPLMDALTSKQINADNGEIREMACLCVDMFDGLAQASEMTLSERIPQLITNYLPQLSSLMTFYANDMTVCETLLRFFRDYTAHFISILDRDQSYILFQSSAELLRSYSVNHWSSRTIMKKSQTEISAEEEQAYSDIICSIQLLINLGTKDFIDACSSNEGVDSTQVTDVIFFGLQQILPLMTQGLLQYPTLCSLFFELVGFMVDTYPEKLCVLPFELFDSLLESLVFGMSHHDPIVAKNSLQGISSICREHLSTGILKTHIDRRPEILDQCTKRLLSDIVYQPIVVDRMEAAAMTLMYISACDVNRFANVVQELSLLLPNPQQRARLDVAYTKLIQPDVLSKAGANGYEGRMNRISFRKSFELFVNEIHSFLILR
jgi:hypothetical protein